MQNCIANLDKKGKKEGAINRKILCILPLG